ncbi:MAG: hypothetical protein FWF43_02455 [Propionibacteriaceae bacterium]|nr:hypothetical protein [Propionibacteriaceae bacterium]
MVGDNVLLATGAASTRQVSPSEGNNMNVIVCCQGLLDLGVQCDKASMMAGGQVDQVKVCDLLVTDQPNKINLGIGERRIIWKKLCSWVHSQ